MHDEGGGLSIVFNGEIYNFADLRRELESLGYYFRSRSDTEVILYAYRQWGYECLSRFNGMFSFALYDAERQQVFLARDRAGEKPLFYHHDRNSIFFSSEIKALLVNPRLPRRISVDALDCYLALGFSPGSMCILDGYNKLPAAHALLFNLCDGSLRQWQYWRPPALSPEAAEGETDENTLVDELESRLRESVKRQLVADVPVGILLSGGVDSSLITALASQVSSRVKTFTIGFPGQGELDETKHARLISRHFNTDHVELAAGDATVELLPRLARYYDEPINDSSMLPTFLVSQLVREHCTVALGGDGGDELFGGYDHYGKLLWLETRARLLPQSLRKAIAFGSSKLMPLGFTGRNWLTGIGCDFRRNLPLIAYYFDERSRRCLMKRFHYWRTVAEAVARVRVPTEADLIQRATRFDFQNYLTEDILVKVDRASMANSLELRAPFLDLHMLEFAFGRVPSRLKVAKGNKKILLKRLAERILPREFDLQRKRGFSIPIQHWLEKGPFRDLFLDVLTDPQCVFDRAEIDRLFRGQDKGRRNGERLFSLVMFELWRNEYGISL